MKIIFPFYGKSFGGSQWSIITNYKYLIQNNIDCFFIVHQENGIFVNFLKKNNIPYMYLNIDNLAGQKPNILSIIFRIIINFYKLRKFVKKNKIDIVHGNDLSINLTWSLSLIFSKTKFIWHQRQPLSQSLYWYSIKFITNHVVANSKFVFETLPKNLSKKSLIYNSFNDIKFFDKNMSKEYVLNKYDIDKKKFVIGYVGRVVDFKRVLFILDGFIALLNNKNINKKIHLLIVGKSNDKYYEKIIYKINSMKVSENVTLVDHVDNPLQIIAGVDLIISATKEEAFGRTIVESMLQKTALLCSNSGGHKELTKNNITAKLFEYDDLKNFENSAMSIINDDENRLTIINNAYLETQKKFYNSDELEKLLNLYKSL